MHLDESVSRNQYLLPSVHRQLFTKQTTVIWTPAEHTRRFPSFSGARRRLFPRQLALFRGTNRGGPSYMGMIYIGPRGLVHAVCSVERWTFQDGPLEHLFIYLNPQFGSTPGVMDGMVLAIWRIFNLLRLLDCSSLLQFDGMWSVLFIYLGNYNE